MSRTPASIVAASVAVVLMLWCARYVPGDIEAFVTVHRLACRAPLSHLDPLENGCNGYTLDFGAFRYHRSYEYVGATSSVLYWPVWALWKSPASFYVLGAVLLVLFSLLLARALKQDACAMLIPLCHFPLVYAFVQDTGPVRIACLSLPLFVLLVHGVRRTTSRLHEVIFATLAAILVLVCVEDKPFYLFVAPTILFSVIAAVQSAQVGGGPLRIRDVIRQRWTAVAVFSGLVVLGLGVLLVVGHSNGVPYFSYLRGRAALLQAESRGVIGTAKYLFEYSLFPAIFPNRVFGWDRTLKMASGMYLIPEAGLAYALWRAKAVDVSVARWLAAAYGCGAIVALLTNIETEAHHFVFLHLPIVVLLMHAAGRGPATWHRVMWGVLSSAVLTLALLTVHGSKPFLRERPQILAYLNRPDVASTYVISASEVYDQLAVYGDDAQIVTLADPIYPSTSDDAGVLLTLAQAASRDILYVCRACTRADVVKAFAGHEIDEIPLGTEMRRAFRVQRRPDSHERQ